MSDFSVTDQQMCLFDFINIQPEAESVFLCLAELDRSVSLPVLSGILQGRKTKYIRQAKLYKLSTYGDLSDKTLSDCLDLCHCLLDQGFLRGKRLYNDYLAVSLSQKGLKQLQHPKPIFLVPFNYTEKDVRHYEQMIDCYDQLITVRRNIYQKEKRKHPNFRIYQIATNKELRELVKYPPLTQEELAERFEWNSKLMIVYLPLFFDIISAFRSLVNE